MGVPYIWEMIWSVGYLSFICFTYFIHASSRSTLVSRRYVLLLLLVAITNILWKDFFIVNLVTNLLGLFITRLVVLLVLNLKRILYLLLVNPPLLSTLSSQFSSAPPGTFRNLRCDSSVLQWHHVPFRYLSPKVTLLLCYITIWNSYIGTGETPLNSIPSFAS